jgi:hypothetical protein
MRAWNPSVRGELSPPSPTPRRQVGGEMVLWSMPNFAGMKTPGIPACTELGKASFGWLNALKSWASTRTPILCFSRSDDCVSSSIRPLAGVCDVSLTIVNDTQKSFLRLTHPLTVGISSQLLSSRASVRLRRCSGRSAFLFALPKNSPFDVLNCSAFLVDGWKTRIGFGFRSAKGSIVLPQRDLSLWGQISFAAMLFSQAVA